MLRSLYIKNYALIEEFSVTFERGLNIITGETGAGKSIVLGAFGLLIGDRATPNAIREGADKAVVEAEFEIGGNPSLRDFFESNAIESEGDALIIRREVSRKGTSRGFINDSPASAQLLKELSEYLVDLHGQHEHQSLLHAKHHIRMLDEFAGLAEQVKEFQTHRAKLIELSNEIQEMKARERRLKEEHDLYAFQYEEILAANPEPGEDEALDAKLRVMENAEELRTSASGIEELLYDGEGSAAEKLGAVKEQLLKLSGVDASLAEPLSEAKSALAIVTELSRWLKDYSERIALDPEELDTLRSRAQQIQRLKKKFGGTLEAVLAKKADLEEKLTFENEFEERISGRELELDAMRKECSSRAAKLSRARKDNARKLEPQIAEVLKDLGIEHGRFSVKFSSEVAGQSNGIELAVGGAHVLSNARGIDTVEFYISTNAGESPKPLAQVASGGEISRIMLALKTILAKSDRLPLLIFDEIDIGISGRVAQRVGRAMKALSHDHQIIAITHLAQIAACGDAHYLAEKRSQKGSTSSKLRRLTDAEHIEEVARLISGDLITPSSLENARMLIDEAVSNSQVTRKSRAKVAAA